VTLQSKLGGTGSAAVRTLWTGTQMKLDKRNNHFAAQQHKKITNYYNIYKTYSPCSYTVTKTCRVFIK